MGMMQGRSADGNLDPWWQTAVSLPLLKVASDSGVPAAMEGREGSNLCAEVLTQPWASPAFILQTNFCPMANCVCGLSVPRE